MDEMSSDWHERLDKAKTNEDFINLLNEVNQSHGISLMVKDGQESSTTERPPMLRPLNVAAT